MTQVAIVLITAMVFAGMSIQIARFHSQSRGDLCARQSTYWLRMEGGLIREGGGVLAGFYGTCTWTMVHLGGLARIDSRYYNSA